MSSSYRFSFPSDTMNKKYKLDTEFRDSKYGLIRNGCERDTDQLVAFKFIKKCNELGEVLNLETPSLITRETSKIMLLNHANVIRYLRTETDDTFFYLVFENLPLAVNDFETRQAIIKNQVSIKYILQGILRGIEYLRSQNCTHEDLRPEFVLFDPESKRVKIGYFGEASSIEHIYNYYKLYKPSPYMDSVSLYYKAPEALLNISSSKAADIWSVGCIFAEMITERPLFPCNGWFHSISGFTRFLGKAKIEPCAAGQFTLFKNFDYNDLTKEFPGLEPAGVDLISRMLRLDPDERITPQEALEHEYFKDL